MIQDTIKKIRSTISGAENLDTEKKKKLQDLVRTLEDELAILSEKEATQARSISNFAHVSTHEAVRHDSQKKLLDLSLEGLRGSVERIEASHPRLTETVNELCTFLGNLGI
jgi:hypothetical protein